MVKDVIILVSAWIITIVMLVIFTPRNKFREGQVIFLFKLMVTWFLGVIVVQLGLIEYPVRPFPYATRTSFSFEIFIYPALCVIFNLHYPEGKGYLQQFMHYFYYCSAMTFFEVLCERYTMLIKYIHWAWYTTWISLFVTFYISRMYYHWFYKIKKAPA